MTETSVETLRESEILRLLGGSTDAAETLRLMIMAAANVADVTDVADVAETLSLMIMAVTLTAPGDGERSL